MKASLSKEAKTDQRTLVASLLLSLWAPLATGAAVAMNPSVTQFADFFRRTVEFFVLLLSFLAFRYLIRDVEGGQKQKWEKILNHAIVGALGISGLIMVLLGVFRLRSGPVGGKPALGLIIAFLGLGVNFWFWRRYRVLGKKRPSAIMETQRQIYLAKVAVDCCVLLALGTVAIWPDRAGIKYVDALGSVAVGFYLLANSWRNYRAGKSIAARS